MKHVREFPLKPWQRQVADQRPTLDEVRTFEQAVGVILPLDYREFLLTLNGGKLPLCEYSGQDALGSIDRFFYLGQPEALPLRPMAEGWDYGNLYAETRVRRPWIGERGVPIGSNGGGDIIFLDYRTEMPIVSVMSGSTRGICGVARSFGEFVASLQLL